MTTAQLLVESLGMRVLLALSLLLVLGDTDAQDKSDRLEMEVEIKSG